MAKIDLLSLPMEELQAFIEELGEKKFRGQQIFQWVQKGVKDIDEMTNLSKDFRNKLKEASYISCLRIEKKLASKIDATKKYLFLLEDRHIIEGVAMSYRHGLTACLSSQVGCGMGCSFCASTKQGLLRNLRAGEMIDQILLMQKDLGERISNIVLMGSGEPLHNFKEVIAFLKVVNDANGINIGNRHITLSTCGLVPEIKKLADLQIPINLAVSLHAPNDQIRQQTMPIAKRYSIEELIAACRYYLEKNSRRITFEYALIKDFNDRTKHAEELSMLLKGLLCHVNLIPVNPIDDKSFQRSKSDNIRGFEKILLRNGIETTVRREMGADIDAACGQLRNRYFEGREM